MTLGPPIRKAIPQPKWKPYVDKDGRTVPHMYVGPDGRLVYEPPLTMNKP